MVYRAGWGVAKRALGALPLSFWLRQVSKNAVALCYHIVSDVALPHVRHNFPCKTRVMFEDDLAYLAERFQVVGIDDYVRPRPSGARTDRALALITFDDGMAECHSVVRRSLRRFGLTAAFFVTTDVVDNRSMIYRQKVSLCIDAVESAVENRRSDLLRAVQLAVGQTCENLESFRRFALSLRSDRSGLVDRMCGVLEIDLPGYQAERRPYLTTEQIRDLVRDGFAVGAHSLNHHDFAKLDPPEMERQIVESCKLVADMTGRSPVPFAFPFNMLGLDRGRLARIARENPVVGTMFGTAGPFPDPPYVQRLFADQPAGALPGRSNLPLLLREGYLNLVKSRLRSFLGR